MYVRKSGSLRSIIRYNAERSLWAVGITEISSVYSLTGDRAEKSYSARTCKLDDESNTAATAQTRPR